jgi:hypothetical protein
VAATALVLLGLFAGCIVLSARLIGWFRAPAPAPAAGRACSDRS